MKAGDLTHPLTAARPLARAAAAPAYVLAVLCGLAAAGCAGSPAGTGSPVPAPAISRLTVIGSRAAKADGDAAPSQMTAVLTTHAKALTSATPGDLVAGAGGVPVFLVTMRGHFAATAASRPPGAAAPAGSYLSIVVDTRTFQVLDSGLSPGPPPVSPASLGPVTYLTRSPALTDPPHHDAPLQAIDALDAREPPNCIFSDHARLLAKAVQMDCYG